MLPISPVVNRPLELQELLDSREYRSFRQKEWLAIYSSTLVSLTVVAPGAVKDSKLTRKLFNHCWQELMKVCENSEWEIKAQSTFELPTGAEGLIAISAPASIVKKTLLNLEETHPLGRLWDIDVINSDGRILSRTEFNYPPRNCLLCNNPASFCSRTRTHAIPDLIARMEAMLDNAANIC